MSLCSWPFSGRESQRLLRPISSRIRTHQYFCRPYHDVSRYRVSGFWIPTGGIAKHSGKNDSNDLLVQAGYLRQAYSGVFHLLPLGLRVQEKLERLIDKHMRQLNASKVALSSLSSQTLWKKTGRLNDDSEIFRFSDRKKTPFILAPTHEEEITSLVSALVRSYKDLPLKIYQVSRKYRDEPRPRQGLLRGREFVMKDLYTFDYNETEAMKTYNAVKDTYVNLFDELGIPYLVATAASGNMGGKFSHEFHFPSPKGEDTVVSCSSCGHTFNEELASGKARVDLRNQQSTVKTQASTGLGCQEAPAVSTGQWTSISKDKRVLVRAFYPKYLLHDGESNPVEREINTHALKSVVDAYGVNLDNSVQDPFSVWKAKVETDPTDPGGDMRVLDVYDYRVRVYDRPPIGHLSPHMSQNIRYELLKQFPNSDNCLDLLRAKTGDECTNCREPTLKTDHAIEIAHTFHLGTRYSDILDAKVAVKPALVKKMDQKSDKEIIVPLQMGCHGIGVSRMMCAVADALADDRGLNWPQAIAPFQAVIVPAKGLEKEAEQVYDKLLAHGEDSMDIILDDRPRDLPWKLRDADLVGYPIILVVGKKSWASENKVEVQCRRMGDLRDTVHLDELPVYVKSLLSKLS